MKVWLFCATGGGMALIHDALFTIGIIDVVVSSLGVIIFLLWFDLFAIPVARRQGLRRQFTLFLLVVTLGGAGLFLLGCGLVVYSFL